MIAQLGSCRVADLATHFGVSHVTVSRTVARLVQEGLAETEPHRPIFLTSKGKRLATEARARHQIVFQFLRSIGVSEQAAALDAEGIEHHVSKETLRCMKVLISARDGNTTERSAPSPQADASARAEPTPPAAPPARLSGKRRTTRKRNSSGP